MIGFLTCDFNYELWLKQSQARLARKEENLNRPVFFFYTDNIDEHIIKLLKKDKGR